MRYRKWIFVFGVAVLVSGCQSKPEQTLPQQTASASPVVNFKNAAFMSYWYAGKAELSRYRLEQARYGELREGDAVLIFVTEDFLTDKQVKLESQPRSEVPLKFTSVLKCNFTKHFVTGVYDYTLLTSVFTPVEIGAYPHTLKTTAAVLEWCGQTFTQLNYRAPNYQVQGYSYFEAEGDAQLSLESAVLEDELWTKLRLSPVLLPTGEFKIIPASTASRLLHRELKAESATADLKPYLKSEKSDSSTVFTGDSLMVYTLTYPAWQRSLKIIFENKFPYRIAGWEETYLDKPGSQAPQTLTTRAVRTNTIMLDYWAKKSLADSVSRRDLGLSY
ncbi:MAG: hypothetical protein IAF08_10680 [Rhizobacter sp.]|nr:hypothetical protein [Chlorobiales bacterium]